MAEPKAAPPKPAPPKPAAPQAAATKVSEMTEQQAKEFHEQFKTTYTAFVGIAALAHLMVFASNPWF